MNSREINDQTSQQRVYNWLCYISDEKSPIPRNLNVGSDPRDNDPYNSEDGAWMEDNVMTKLKISSIKDFEMLMAYLRDGLAAASRFQVPSETLSSKIEYIYLYIGLMIKNASKSKPTAA